MLITAVGGTLSLLLLGGGASAALGGTLHPLSSSDIELQRSLVGWWRLDGNVNDSTPYRNNGTVNGATLTTDKAGNANSAYQLGNSAAQRHTAI